MVSRLEMSADSDIEVLVVHAPTPDTVWQQRLRVPFGSSVAQALTASDFKRHFPLLNWQECGVGIFGKRVTADQVLDGEDRIEIYRGLTFDPKESRRRRAAHRQRSTRKRRNT